MSPFFLTAALVKILFAPSRSTLAVTVELAACIRGDRSPVNSFAPASVTSKKRAWA